MAQPGPGLTVVRSGTLVLVDLPTGATVYANELPRAVGRGDNARIALVPGSHHIIVDMPGGYPWNDVIAVRAAEETRVYPSLRIDAWRGAVV